MLMFKEKGVSREYATENEWLEDIFYRSNSNASLVNATVVLKAFDIFCQNKLGIEDPDPKELEREFRKKHNLKPSNRIEGNPAWSVFLN